jgi:hypothetical protein
MCDKLWHFTSSQLKVSLSNLGCYDSTGQPASHLLCFGLVAIAEGGSGVHIHTDLSDLINYL